MFTYTTKTTSRTDFLFKSHQQMFLLNSIVVQQPQVNAPGVTVPRTDFWTCKGASVHNPQVFRSYLSHREFLGTGQPIVDTYCFKIQISFPSP